MNEVHHCWHDSSDGGKVHTAQLLISRPALSPQQLSSRLGPGQQQRYQRIAAPKMKMMGPCKECNRQHTPCNDWYRSAKGPTVTWYLPMLLPPPGLLVFLQAPGLRSKDRGEPKPLPPQQFYP